MARRVHGRVIRVRRRGARGISYPVYIGRGVLSSLPGALRRLAPAYRYFLITDSRVRGLHGRALLASLRRAGLTVSLLSVPAGERSKTREAKARLEDRILALGGGRDSAVLALGGGMICDLAGFTAATYHRGIPFVPIPTTLLAMVDAAVGGKTAVDHPRGKNVIGAFHPPRAVFADLRFLETLPEREFRSGLAEAVKSAVIGDPVLFRGLERDPSAVLSRHPGAVLNLVLRSCRVKARVVEADERESGLRAVLNFGHTLGHALEHLLHYRLLHGEAVAIGMALEARAAAAAGIMKAGEAGRIIALLGKLGLPTRLPKGVPPGRVLIAARADKKAERGEIRYALPRKIGEMARRQGRHVMPLSERLVLAALQ
ncbi:MAG TPA: 3-dehydroquinate synthase [Candidatus Polarisedimenticolia bacterium]|nr:3-dehydroquinate synthase [Candidatus Polarisedimenticolia bacterium]